MNAADIEVKYGYTLRDLQQMTNAATIADRSLAMDYTERRDIAWSAIAEALCSAPHWPKRSELIQAGWQAIYKAIREEYRQHGRADRSGHSELATAPNFLKYWMNRATSSPENPIVERLAVNQVVDTLPPLYRNAVIALAVHEDYVLAAESLGITYKALGIRLSKARRQLLRLWFEGETPPSVRYIDRRVRAHGSEPATHCSRGHEWTPENTRIRRRKVRGGMRIDRDCRACERNRKGVPQAVGA
ncbi:hypothetical protein NE236_41540 [Actinoallomurus purpureus]|uniref:hypothetical protein n=1 Tax=Actinoallomurus purpureus TaxID=478114 RepID=UPI0020939590|nr:hypothetical protein [Actinoallomurus purpureus]MCO6011453.1 hypothetical protein [Actinoallomurus purpureus]